MNRWRSSWDRLAGADPDRLDEAEVRELATAAFMLGRYRESVELWDRAHRMLLEQGDPAGACRSLFWLMLAVGEDDVSGVSRIGGELARIERVIEDNGLGDLEQAYLRCYAAIDLFVAGVLDKGLAAWAGIAATGRAHDDADVWVFGAQGQARTLMRLGRVREGTALLDEIFLTVASGALTPMMAGWVYCSCLAGCYEGFDLGRAAEWTRSASDWVDQQEGLQTFTGVCLLFRARVHRRQGEWDEATVEIEQACEQLSRGRVHHALGEAHYERAELLRLRGDRDAAEADYRMASRFGFDPQPGLAMLRLGEGRTATAGAALRRALDEATDATRRAELLPSLAEAALADGNATTAEQVCRELEELAAATGSQQLSADALLLRGRLHLAADDARAALDPLRGALRLWIDLEASLDEARTRSEIAAACEALGDADTAALERAWAHQLMQDVGASGWQSPAPDGDGSPLTEREVEVVREVAAGLSNRAVARQLHITEKTVASHLSHIFTKLGVSNRAGVTAYYYERLVDHR